MAGTSSNDRGDYKNVALEEEDIVEMKKAIATGSKESTAVSSRKCFYRPWRRGDCEVWNVADDLAP